MDRYRWFKVKLPDSFEASIKKILVVEYETTQIPGFFLLDHKKQYFDFLYRWITNIEAITFSNGEAATNVISILNSVQFSLFEKEKKVWIKVKNPPRSLKELFFALELAFGFGFSIESTTLSAAAISRILRKLDDHRLISFKANGSVVEDQTIFRLEAASKVGIDIDSFRMLRETRYSLDHSCFEVSHKGYKGQFSSGGNGTIKVSGDISNLLLGLIENGVTTQ
jgi:hypothetical protein